MSNDNLISRQLVIEKRSLQERLIIAKTLLDGVIKDLPFVQPKIVRCKDCKHYQFADNRAFGMPVKMCEWFGFEDVDDDDFCSRAERREE